MNLNSLQLKKNPSAPHIYTHALFFKKKIARMQTKTKFENKGFFGINGDILVIKGVCIVFS